jgi:predicted RNA-binding protein with PIN domain
VAEPSPETDYSEDAAAALVRGLGAFIRVAQTQKLTPALRRLRSFRPQTLLRHRGALLTALEDEDLRASLLEWLDDGQVPLSKEDAAVLRTAAARPEGWRGELAPAPSEEPDRPDPGADIRRLEARLAREHDKVRAARSETRNAKEASRRQEEAAARKIEELRGQVAAIGAELEEARAESSRAVRAAEQRVAAAERAVRKASRAEEKAEEQAEGDRKRFRDVSKELGKAKRLGAELETEVGRLRADADRLRDEADRLRAEVGRLSSERQGVVEPRPGQRKRGPLPVPKGRMPEDPQTLAEWLATPGVRLLVDGYNVTKAEGGYGDLPLERQRERLIDEVRTLVARVGVPTVIVFDGSEVMPGAARRMHGGVAVEYSKPDESADDHIIALVDATEGATVVTTNDRDLQNRAAALGATVATSDQLLALIR